MSMLTDAKERWSGAIVKTVIGATADQGGTRSSTVTVGGETGGYEKQDMNADETGTIEFAFLVEGETSASVSAESSTGSVSFEFSVGPEALIPH